LVEGLDDGGLAHVNSILHRELKVLVGASGQLRVEEGLKASCLVVVEGVNPLTIISSPQLLVEPSVG